MRLPKGIAYEDGTELVVERNGDVVTLRPALKSLAWMVAELRRLPKPDSIEVREPIEFPERPGL